VVQLALIFLVDPLSTMGFDVPLALAPPIMVVLILVIAAHRPGALIVTVIAVVTRLITGVVEMKTASIPIEAVDAATSVVALVAVGWAISGVVFSPGRITSHRVLGAVVLYLAVAMTFAWLYQVIAELVPGAFNGLTFHEGGVFGIAPFNYFSLTALTTVGFGDITPINAIARSLTTLEAVIGQLYPSIILARILTLYSEGRGQAAQQVDEDARRVNRD
jgi:hypothetical protein